MATEFSPAADRRVFAFDVLRSIVLGAYIRQWGMPEYRVKLKKGVADAVVEVYTFPASNPDSVSRLATVGLSASIRPTGEKVGAEWMMVLPRDWGGVDPDRVLQYFADLIANHIENATNSELPRVMPESKLAPESWTTKAVLIDEPRGEDQSIDQFSVGNETVQLCWVVPITAREAAYILKNGIEAFDAVEAKSSYSLIDVKRPSFV